MRYAYPLSQAQQAVIRNPFTPYKPEPSITEWHDLLKHFEVVHDGGYYFYQLKADKPDEQLLDEWWERWLAEDSGDSMEAELNYEETHFDDYFSGRMQA